MANDDTAPGLTPEEIAERHRLAPELMRPGSPADLPPDFLAQRDQQIMARLLLNPRPMASTTDLNAPAVRMPSGPSSPYAPDSVERLMFDATPMWSPTRERLLPGAAPILPPGLSRLPGPGGPASAAAPSPATTADDMVEIPVLDGMGMPTGQTQIMPASSIRSLSQQMRDAGREADNFVRLAADGATFGLADKAAARMRALTGDAPSYGEALKEERARTMAAGEKIPSPRRSVVWRPAWGWRRPASRSPTAPRTPRCRSRRRFPARRERPTARRTKPGMSITGRRKTTPKPSRKVALKVWHLEWRCPWQPVQLERGTKPLACGRTPYVATFLHGRSATSSSGC